MDMRAFFDEWLDRFWVNEDLSAADDMIKPDIVIRGLTDGPQFSAQGMKDYGAVMLKHCNFHDVRIVHFSQTGDWAHMLIVLEGVGRQTQKPLHFDVQLLARADGDHVVEAYNHLDHLTVLQQLGVLPKDTFAKFLGLDGVS